MKAGKLDRRVTIRQPLEVQSDSGEVVTTWQDLATVWAEQVDVPGSERYVDPQVVGRALSTFHLRYSSTTRKITAKSRLIVDGREYDVTDVRETKTREELQIDCFARSEQQVATGPNVMNSVFVPNNATLATVDSTMTLSEDLTLNAHYLDNFPDGVQPAGTYVYSLEFKAAGPTDRGIAFGVWNAATFDEGWSADFVSVSDPPGTLESRQDFPAPNFMLQSVAAEGAGDGWWRFSARFTIVSSATLYVWVNMTQLGNSPPDLFYAGDGSAINLRNLSVVME